MFRKLTDFSYKRNTNEAIGFYIAYLVLLILVAMIAAGVMGIASGNEGNFEYGVRIGQITSIVTVLFLSFSIIKSKKLSGNFAYILIALCSGLLAYFGGGILGLIPAAFLSTKK